MLKSRKDSLDEKNTDSDIGGLKHGAKQRVKLGLMGGSMIDSSLRLFLVLLTVIFFVYLLVSLNYAYGRNTRIQHCFASAQSDFSLQTESETTNVTLHWRKLYYYTIAVQLLSCVQIGVAMASFSLKKFSYLDRLSVVLTLINLLT